MSKKSQAIRKQEQLLKRAQKLDDAAIIEMRKVLREIRAEITARVAEHELNISAFPAIKRDVENQIKDFENRFKVILQNKSEDAFVAGQAIVDGGLAVTETGRNILNYLPVVDDAALLAMTDYSADLVTKVSADLKQFINNQVFLGTQGGTPLSKIVQNIGTRIDKGVFKSARARAEAIARTEINRVLSTAQEIRNQQVAEIAPETKKYWLTANDNRVRPTHIKVGAATDPAKGGKPIGINESFSVGGYSASGPHDPNLPASEVIQCRCSKILIINE